VASFPVIDTPRLRLRRPALDDAPEMRRLAGDPAVADTTLNIPHPYPEGAAEQWIAEQWTAFAAGTDTAFTITEREADRLIGVISLTDIRPAYARATLGYWIGRPYWGRGYCTEAGRAVIDYGFKTLDLNRIQATHFSRNPASGRVMAKLGMLHEGTLRQHVTRWDHPEDEEIRGILRADWAAGKSLI
jgi:[ribosomal protein S5]-alanine N-acetyltransferase